MSSFVKTAKPPIAASAGLQSVPPRPADPYQALDELMAVVEVLCPVWPPRPPFVDGDKMLL